MVVVLAMEVPIPSPLLLSISTPIITLMVSVVLCYVLFFWNWNWKQHQQASSSAARRAPLPLPLPPGPRGWPVLGNLPQLGGKTHQTLHEMSKAYGPLLRLRFGSSNVVVAGSAAVAEQFLRAHDANFSCRPPNSGGEHMAYNYRDVVFAPYGPRWRAMRKVCAVNLFSARPLDGLRAVREREAALMVASLAAAAAGRGGEAVSLRKAANACTTYALSRAAVGRRVFASAGDDGEGATEFKEIVLEVMQVGGVLNVGDFVPALRWLDPQGVVAKMKKLHRRFDDTMDRIIADRKAGFTPPAAAEGGQDLLGLLLAMVEDQRLPAGAEDDVIMETDVKALILNLFVAGTDTTSSIVEWLLAELIRHPDILRQAQEELDVIAGRERLVSEADLQRLTFFNAVVKETFRLHPSTPLSLPRMAAAECEVAGYRIPKGSELLVNVWGIARDPAVWPDDPLEFRPARFLPGGSHAGVDVKGGDFGLIPFGAGRRICAGLTWGLRMVTLASATLVHAFDWELPPGQTPEKLSMEEAFTLMLQRAVPLMARPLPRLLPPAYEIA